MKVRTHREIPQANKIFTDREQPRISFWNSYNEYKTNMQTNGEIKVLAYYGIGGIGKTSLLRKLMSEMNEKLDRPQYVYYDDRLSIQVQHSYKKNFLSTSKGVR